MPTGAVRRTEIDSDLWKQLNAEGHRPTVSLESVDRLTLGIPSGANLV